MSGAATLPGAIMPHRQTHSTDFARSGSVFFKRPEHIENFLTFRIYNFSKLAARGVGLMLRREAGISLRDSRILAYVGKQPNMSLTKLAHVAELDPVVTSRCVAKLVARGLIVKTRLSSNKRLIVLALTNVGRAIYQQARNGGQRYNIDFAACLSDREAVMLDVLLTKLERRARELTEREIAKNSSARL
jgi:DNA-binding MarR family transcriptional regulator